MLAADRLQPTGIRGRASDVGTHQLPQPHTAGFSSPEEQERAQRFSRLLVVFAKQAANALPVVGPLVSGGLEVIQRVADDAELRGLEQRVEQLVTAGGQLSQDVAHLHDDLKVLTALAVVGFAHQAELLAWVQTQRHEPVVVEELTEFALQAALAAYRAQIAVRFCYADHRGIQGAAKDAHLTTLPLDAIYVVPDLVSEQARTDADAHEQDLLTRLDDPDLDPAERVGVLEAYAAATGWRWRPGDGKQGVPVGQALGGVRQAVLLGGPGVGKSTMVRYLARTCALGEQAKRLGWDEPLIPVVLPLAAFAEARRHTPTLTVRQQLDEQARSLGGEALQAAQARELGAGRALVLLDGIDEIPEHSDRLHIVRAVDQFLLELGSGAQASRCLITSRPHGYIRLAGPIPHFQVPNFTPDQVRVFVHNWQDAFERARHPDAPNPQRATAEAQALLDELGRNPKVAELASNPLMLVIVSLIRYEQARLPEERVRLYDRAVLTLLDSWNHGRSLAEHDVGGMSLPVNQLVEVWGKVAAWTRQDKPTGIIHRAELKRHLIRTLQDLELDDDDDPAATAESYLRAAADRAGLLEERGPEVFAFWHPTFEEFLAAIELATPTSHAARRLLPLRDDPRWREAILLAVGYIGVVQRDRTTASALVEAIANEDPGPLEPVLHPNLLLAVACVAEEVGVTRATAERIIARLAEIVSSLPYQPYRQTFVRAVRGLPRLRPQQPATIAALVALTQAEAWDVRMEATRWLANIAAESADARHACEQLLADRDPDVRCHAAFGLARAGDDRPEVWGALAGYTSQWTHLAVTVRPFLNTSTSAQRALHALLSDDDPIMRRNAVWALRDAGLSDPDLLQTLHPLLTHDDPSVRRNAVWALRDAGQLGDPDALRILLSLLTDDDPGVRSDAVWVLRGAGLSDPDLLRTLHPLLTDDDPDVRRNAARVLRDAGLSDPDLLRTLHPLLTHDDPFVQLNVVLCLRGAGQLSDPDTLHNLQTLRPLLTHDDASVRLDALLLLRSSGLAGQLSDPNLLQALQTLLTDRNDQVRRNAAQLMVELGQSSMHTLEVLARLATDSPWAALAACQKLLDSLELTVSDGEALARLVQRQPDDVYRDSAREAIFGWLLTHSGAK